MRALILAFALLAGVSSVVEIWKDRWDRATFFMAAVATLVALDCRRILIDTK